MTKENRILFDPYLFKDRDEYNKFLRYYYKFLNKKKKKNNNKERRKLESKRYRDRHKEKLKIKRKERWNRNKEKYLEHARKRYKNDNQYRLCRILRARINKFISGKSKSTTTKELLGCSLEFFEIYLESKFQTDMTWDNHGQFGWHIDHILPPSRFDLTDPAEQRRLFHYTNLQPLWWKPNIEKGNKIPSEINKNA